MGIRSSGTLLAAVTAAFVIAPGLSALAQFNPTGFGGTGQTTGQGKSNTSNRMGGGTGKGTTTTGTDRMGGGPGKKAATTRMGGGPGKKAATTRMSGGGGKGAVQLNPQPEPPGRAKIK